MVEADEPDASDGVREPGGTSSLGKRDVELWWAVFARGIIDSGDVMGNVRAVVGCGLGLRNGIL